VGGAAGAGTWGQLSSGTFRWVRGTGDRARRHSRERCNGWRKAVASEQPSHARNVTSGKKCWSRGRIVSALLVDGAGGCLPPVEPPYPDASTMDLPAQASKRPRQFDTARYQWQSHLMKPASRSSKPPGSSQWQGFPWAGPQPGDGIRRSVRQPSPCTVSRSSPDTAWSLWRSIGWGKRRLRLLL
jgi:hypothetical protein